MQQHESTASESLPGFDLIQFRAENGSSFQHDLHVHVCAEMTFEEEHATHGCSSEWESTVA